MPDRNSLRSRLTAASGLALVAALVFGASILSGPATTLAQGFVVCPGSNTCLGPSTSMTSCPDGSYIPVGQSCPYYAGYTGYTGYTSCPDGGYVLAGQTCPYNPNYTTCPNGSSVPAGQACPYTSGYTTCPNGSYVPSWQSCPSVTSGYCYSPYGSQPYCPSASVTVATVSYPAGWNIVAGPSGTTISGSPAPLFAFPPGAGSYQTLPQGSSLQAGSGYWAYFTTSTSTTLASGGSGTSTFYLAPGQFTLIGNPGDGVATVSGANVTVFTYSPATGSYEQTNQLAAGQGGWAISTTGGQVTITSTPGLPPPPPF